MLNKNYYSSKTRKRRREFHKWPMNYWPKGAIRLLRKHRWANGFSFPR